MSHVSQLSTCEKSSASAAALSRHPHRLSFLGYSVTWAPEKKMILKERSISGRREMTSRNS